MSTSWSLIAGQVCRDALEHLEVIGNGETMDAGDQNLALRALDVVLKELPLSGYEWPKLSGETALTWSPGSPQTIVLPADYYNYASVWKTVNGQRIPLTQIPHSAWVVMSDRASTAPQPTHFYIDPAKTLNFWPIPTADPVAYVQYQRILDDSVVTSAPDVLQFWLGALGFGVADELSLKFGIDQARRVEIHQRWLDKKQRALDSSISYEPVSFSVDD